MIPLFIFQRQGFSVDVDFQVKGRNYISIVPLIIFQGKSRIPMTFQHSQ